LISNLYRVVDEEMLVKDFTLAEEENKSVENMINDCDNHEESKEMFIP
jgi:hypothetical protein